MKTINELIAELPEDCSWWIGTSKSKLKYSCVLQGKFKNWKTMVYGRGNTPAEALQNAIESMEK